MSKKKELINYLGLLGLISLLSYTAAVIFAPLAYPDYDWMRQAVSDLSASSSPSKLLWNQITSLYGLCGIVSVMMVCVFLQNKLSRTLRVGIYLFAAMNWVSGVGYAMFPLTDSGYAGTVQDIMHMVVTAGVVVLSIASLVVLIVGGFRKQRYVSLAILASITLALMFTGAIGVGAAPPNLFGVFERFSVFSATAFNAALGLYLFTGFKKYKDINSTN